MALHKDAYTTRELSELFACSRQSLDKRSKRESWQSRPRSGRGGGNEWLVASMPESTRAKLAEVFAALLCEESVCPQQAISRPAPASMTDRQREIRDARLVILDTVAGMSVSMGILEAEQRFARMAKRGELNESLMKLVETANARKGSRKALSPATLRNWRRCLKQEGPDSLAPRNPSPTKALVPDWLPYFREHYNIPTKPSVREIHEKLIATPHLLPDGVRLPSLRTVERILKSLGEVEANRGRMLPRELKNLKAFHRRDFSKLLPTDVYTADGHTVDMYVLHPVHGKPFRPEVTSVLDVATRLCVGWSIGLAERGWDVADALRMSAVEYGIPAIFYVDNGSGFKNKLLDSPGMGILARLGTSKEHSIPYNSQARGVIERFQRSCWVRGVSQFPACAKGDMDPEALKMVFKRVKQDIRDTGTTKLMLTWQQFMEWAKQQVEAYNNRPHSSLSGRKTPAQRWEELARFTEVIKPEPEEVDDMFRPYVQRVVRRCELDVFNNRYFSRALEHLHGQEVRVGFDIHDVNKVWVRDLDGRAICTAELNGNRTDYFPVPVIEQAREKRFKARLKRVDVKRQEVIEEFHGVQPTVEAPTPMTEAQRTLHEQVVAELEAAPQANVIRLHKPAPKLPEPETREARFIRAMELERQIEAGRDVAVKEAMWLGGYKTTPEYHSLMELINDFGPEAVGMRA